MTSDVALESVAPRRVRELARLGPVAQLRAGRLTRRLSQLALGLALYGLTLGMMIRATLGNAPWDVLHQGMAMHLPMTIGTAVIVMSVVVLLFWIPLRELPGLGTVLNSIAVGLTADLTLSLLEAPEALWQRGLLMVGGVVLNALATALYIGSQFGPGPRDGLMTGLHRRTGVSIRVVRTGLEVLVVAIGWVLGGVLGIGTVLYAVAIGPLVQLMLPRFIVELEVPTAEVDVLAGAGQSASPQR
jgi:uncharacterized membrane protein YczE